MQFYVFLEQFRIIAVLRFNRYLNITPVRYMNDLRLARGRSLLAETDMKVTEVAVACGYASTSHFSKSFRKKYGTSPYRFSHIGG